MQMEVDRPVTALQWYEWCVGRKGTALKPPLLRIASVPLSLYPSVPLCPTAPPPSFILPSHFPPAHFCCSRWYFFDTLSLFTVFFCLCYFINFFLCTQLPWFICVASVLKGLSFSSLLSVSFLSPTLVYAGILSRLLSCVERERIAELWGGKEGRESEKKDRGMKAKVEGGGHWKGWHWLGQLAQGVCPGVLFWEGLWPLSPGCWVTGCLDPSSRQLGMGAIITTWLISTERKSLFSSLLGSKRPKVFVLLLLLV